MKIKYLLFFIWVLILILVLGQIAIGAPKLTMYAIRWYPKVYNDSLEEAAQEFEKQTGCEVEIVWGGDFDIRAKYYSAIETNTLPDVGFGWALQHPLIFHALGILEDVTDIVTKKIEKYGGDYGSTFPYSLHDEKYFTVPWFTIPDVLHVREDRLSEAGVSLPTTWDEVLEAAVKTTNPEQNIYGFGEGPGRSNLDHEKWVRSMLFSYGGGVFGEDSKTVILDSPETAQVMHWIKDGWNAKIFPPDGTQWDSAGNNKSWLSGQANMIWNAASTVWSTFNEVPEIADKMEVVAAPAGPAGRKVFSDQAHLMIFKGTKELDLAKQFVEFLVDTKWYKQAIMPHGVPAYMNFTTDPIWNEQFNKYPLETAAFLTPAGYPGSPTPAATDLSNLAVLADMTSSMLLYDISPDDVASTFVAQVESIVKRWEKITNK